MKNALAVFVACALMISFSVANAELKNQKQLSCTTYKDSNSGDNDTALTDAINHGRTDCVLFLLKNGANPNARQKQTDLTPLFVAVTEGNIKMVRTLVKFGADLHAQNAKFGTAYESAVAQGEYNIAKFLKGKMDEKYKKTAPTFQASGTVACTADSRNGMAQKYVIYKVDGKTYAINGTARGRAEYYGWLDGFKKFSPAEMQYLLQQGLASCN